MLAQSKQTGGTPTPPLRHQIRPHVQGLEAVLRETYRRSYFANADREHLKRPRGSEAPRVSSWALDTRVALSQSELLRPISSVMSDVLVDRGLEQIVGYGYGSFLLVGGILASASGLAGGLLRETQKTYGFRQIVEGSLDPAKPLIVVDDVLASGRSAIRAAEALQAAGYKPRGVFVVFEYGWKLGAERLREAGLGYLRLATLENTRTAVDTNLS